MLSRPTRNARRQKSCHRQDVADRRAGKPSAGSSSRNSSTVERCSIRFRASKRIVVRGFVVSLHRILQASTVICASGTRLRMPSRELLVKFDRLAVKVVQIEPYSRNFSLSRSPSLYCFLDVR